MARSRSHGKGAKPYICIAVSLHVAINNINNLSVYVGMLQLVAFALLSSCRILRNPVNNINKKAYVA